MVNSKINLDDPNSLKKKKSKKMDPRKDLLIFVLILCS